MSKKLSIRFDSDLLEAIASDFDLRTPNKEALRQLIFTLDGDYDPDVMQVLNLATGVGKTYLMAAFIEYLRQQGVNNVMIVTPGKTVQAKTVQNFTEGSPRFIPGAAIPPAIVTPQDYSAWVARTNGQVNFAYGHEISMLAFIFNIQQLIAPKDEEGDTHGSSQDAMRRKPRRFDENAGVLFDYLKDLDDLVVIADESHLYGSSAAAFNAALRELDPAATIGLTASVDKKTDHVIYEYPLYRAIADKYVKAPVLAFRKSGYGTDKASEEQQLRDALQLRALKQAYYDHYAQQENRARLNAVLFVVCSDVNHATQVSELLRTPEYFGKPYAVLQVDSQHDDDKTQLLLNQLDEPDSPVLAVVSVNKLKEGWDVKNIAVIVTLRAMASEVLTQQTMGRGLRLPFGHYTDIGQIDQLDIIAHQSFTELLAAENVLQQFGLEEAVQESNRVAVDGQLKTLLTSSGSNQSASSSLPTQGSIPATGNHSAVGSAQSANTSSDNLVGASSDSSSDYSSNPRTITFRTINEYESVSTEVPKLEIVSVDRNEKFADVSYCFPVTTVELRQPPVDLAEISDDEIEKAAKKTTSTGDVLLRKEIIAALGKKLRTADRESAEVDSMHIDTEDARQTLVKLVTNIPLIPKTERVIRYVDSYLVPRFIKSVSFDTWTIKSLNSAQTQLRELVKTYIETVLRQTKEVPVIHPKQMPGDGYCLPLGETIHDQVDTRDEFVRGRVYSGWFKSLFAEESFDSYSGEYVLAKLLNTSPSIVWWQRLHPQSGAFVYYNAKDRYFPDFVALDTDGVYWIIEGKDERGRDDEKVQAKRKAAETLVRSLSAEEAYKDQKWGYLIAYEQDTARADSWEDLKTLAQPVSNVF